jgi:magnesium-dependent phosphatase 1
LYRYIPGSKKAHFEKLRAKTKVAYHKMVFFDNEQNNVLEVGQLGVTSVFCPGGMSQGGAAQVEFSLLPIA